MTISTQQDLIDLMEPTAANAPIDTLSSGGMQELAIVSAAISLKRIADYLDGMYIENEGRPAIHVRDLR